MKKSLYCFSCLFYCLLGNLTLSAQEASEHLQNKEYQQALELLKGDLGKDKLLLLTARAQFLSGQFNDSITTAKKLISDHPKSDWTHKAQYIQAQAHSKLRAYDQASAIYEKEATTLFSPTYKDTGAKLLMEVAAKFSYTPKPTELDLPQPDLGKAITLLKEAVELECSLEMKESILAELTSLHTKSNNWNGAKNYSLLYLDQFDPDWKGKLNSIGRITSAEKTAPRKVTLIGKNRHSVRSHLCESLHRNGERVQATRYLEEFILELKQSNNPENLSLLADATWLRLMALREVGGKPRNLPNWISEVKTYLQDYPTHIHSQATAYAIAHSYLGAKKKQKAISAFQDYIDNYHNKFIENPLTARPETKSQFLARKKQNDSRLETAHYLIGKTHLQLNEFEKAKQAWTLYSQKFPNGANWAECQKGLVDIDFNIATHSVTLVQTQPDKKVARANAQKALNDFITKHPLDTRIPTALYLTGNIPFQHANELEKDFKKSPDDTLKSEQNTAYQSAIRNWKTLITKYPRSTHAVQAQYLTGFIYEDKIGDLEKALTIYRQCSHTNAKSHASVLLAKNLVASSDTTFTTTENPHITLSSRNIEKVTVRQYWLDIESYFRKARKLEDITSLDIDLIEADEKWELNLPKYKKYHSMDSKIEIPFPSDKPGICVIKVESESFSTTTMVMRSNIDIAIRSNKEEVITYAHLAGAENSPAKNVRVLIADGGKIIATGKTNNKGIFHYRDDSFASINDLRVLALSDHGAATCSLNKAHTQPARKLTPRAWFNLAKTTYLPGETMKIGGVVRFPATKKSGTIYTAPTEKQRSYTLSIKTKVSEKLLYQQKITTSPSGVFQHTYKLPSYLSSDYFVIELQPDHDEDLPPFRESFDIDRDAQDLVTIKLEMDKKWTTDDSVLNGKVTAKYRWDAPYSDRQFTIHLPDHRSITVKTNAKGEATFRYDAKYEEAGKVITFSVSSLGNEFHSNKAIVLIDPINFSILASTDFATVAAGSEVSLTAKTILPDETPVSRELKLEILQIIRIENNPILLTCKGLEHLTKSSTREKIIQTHPLTTDAETGEILHQLKFDKGGRYLIRLTSQDAKGREVIAKSFIDVHDESSLKKLIIFTDKRDLEVGKTATISTWSYLKSPAKALLTVETNKIIEKRIVTLKPGKNHIPLKLITAHVPKVRVNLMAIHERKFYTISDTLSVTNKLTLKVTTRKINLLNPLTEANQNKKFDYMAKLQAFDANGNPVPADYFVNLTHRSSYTPDEFSGYDLLTS